MKFTIWLGCAICCILMSCASIGSMLPGVLVAKGGEVLDLQIEVAKRTGSMSATSRENGEKFVGQYVGFLDGYSDSTSSFSNGKTSADGNYSTSSHSTSSAFGNAAATAFMTGDKGRTLNCDMMVDAGLHPHGMGNCTDQFGTAYRIQF